MEGRRFLRGVLEAFAGWMDGQSPSGINILVRVGQQRHGVSCALLGKNSHIRAAEKDRLIV